MIIKNNGTLIIDESLNKHGTHTDKYYTSKVNLSKKENIINRLNIKLNQIHT